jgi:CubicO group peptidase (beta-lactamase class C family)
VNGPLRAGLYCTMSEACDTVARPERPSLGLWLRRTVLASASCGTAVIWGCNSSAITAPASSIAQFEQHLENLRASSHIPAITAVIAQGQRVVWTKAFGIADLATQRVAADTTIYHLASLTKTFASTIILQLVEEGNVSLDDPVSLYGINIATSAGVIRVRHLLSHTSQGTPGTSFAYNGDRFGLLDSVIARGAGKPFASALQERIVRRVALQRTAPNPQSPFFDVAGLNRDAYAGNMARGYTHGGNGYAPTPYPTYFGSAAGLTASALDVAAFSMALDRDALLRPETKALAFAPAVTPRGDTLPHALGWFSTRYKGVRVVWHYGLWTAISSLIIKVPERGLTFVVLGNTDALSQPYRLGVGDLNSSPWAREFLETFVIGGLALPSSP